MAKKFLDLEGLRTLWTKIKGTFVDKTTFEKEKARITVNESRSANNQTNIEKLKNDKQDKLVSGTNIKTINNQSLLGNGNLSVVTDLSNYYNKSQTDTAINSAKNDLLGGAGPAFDTLKELSTALGNDPNFATTITNKIGQVKTEILGGASEAYNTLKKLQTATEGKLDISSGNETDKYYFIGDNTGATGGSTDKFEILKADANRGSYSALSLINGQMVMFTGASVGDVTDVTGLAITHNPTQKNYSLKKVVDLTDPDGGYRELLDESMAISESEINAILV